MHAYRQFVQSEMDKRGWTAAELSRASGLTRQNLSRLLNDTRDVLQRRPEPSTVTGLATAFRMSEDQVLSYVAEAMGFKPARIPVSSASALSNEELLRELAGRLKGGAHHGDEGTIDQQHVAGPRADGEADSRSAVADQAQPDGITASDDRPWERDGYDLAAKRGRNRGREAREAQDRAAEDGGA